MNDTLTSILNTTYTQNQLKHRLRVLKSHLLKAFFGGQAAEDLTPGDLNWLSSLPPPIFKNFTKDNVYQILDELDKQSSQLKVLTVYLPIEAGENIFLQIGSYARKTFQNPTLLLDTKFDQSLIAGAAFVWKGIYRDFSLRARIESKKEEILQQFKKYLR